MNFAGESTADPQVAEPLLRDGKRLRLLLDVNNALVSNRALPQLIRAISAALGRVVQHDYSSLCLYDPKIGQFRLHALDFPGGRGLIREAIVFKLEGSPAGEAFRNGKPLVLDDLKPHQYTNQVTQWFIAEGMKSACWMPLLRGEQRLGVLCIGSRRRAAFHASEVPLLTAVAGQVAIAVENALAFQEINNLREELAKEKKYLEDEISAEFDYEGMVGESTAWRQAMEQIETVAPIDATVLIRGETGTGKELVARAIHGRSPRHDCTFVKVNCAAVPSGLLESELFGHERGAFTGAVTQQIGRFELAHKGTLLLDEIGDIPLELQPKILRVLQEQQFERLGSVRTVSVDTRIIAATNRNLEELVAQRQFRDDLYYRINVFPIVVPPLRQRRSDIPLLVRYFVQKHSKRMRRHIESIPPEVLAQLSHADWPGNIRELENVIERAVILSRDGVLRIRPGELQHGANGASVALETVEREHIVKALRESRGVVGGAKGAAIRLGLKRTTLNSRMRKLGITPDGAH